MTLRLLVKRLPRDPLHQVFSGSWPLQVNLSFQFKNFKFDNFDLVTPQAWPPSPSLRLDDETKSDSATRRSNFKSSGLRATGRLAGDRNRDSGCHESESRSPSPSLGLTESEGFKLSESAGSVTVLGH